MLTRSLMLRVLLVALAAAVVLAIAGIFGSSDEIWRFLSTSLALGIAAALSMPFMPGERSGRFTTFGRFAVGYLAIGASAFIAMLWLDGRPIQLPLDLEQAFFTWLWLGLPALLAAVPALRRRSLDDRSLELAERLSIGGSILAAAVGTIGALVSSPVFFTNWSLEIGFVLLAASIASSSAAVGLRRPSQVRFGAAPDAAGLDRRLAPIGIGSAALYALASTMAILLGRGRTFGATPDPNLELAWAIACVPLAPMASIAVWNLTGLATIESPLRYTRHLATASSAACGIVVAVDRLDRTFGSEIEPILGRSFAGQLTATFAIVAGASLLAALVLMRMHRARPIASEPIRSLDWRCPRCERRSEIALGEHSCAGCGLAVLIDVRDDRCPKCGYDLRGLPPGSCHCPECGRARQTPAGTGTPEVLREVSPSA